MKRIYYAFALWLTFTITFAQSGGVPYTAKQDSIRRKIPKITMEDVSNLLPQITPKSPNVAAMERYGTIPVSMYTGLPNIEIPIFEFKIGGLSVPIKLTYHASGNKVNDNASWVGLGWTLQAGGSVSRIVKGKRDEDDFSNNNSLLQNQLPADYANWTANIPCLTETLETELNQYADFGKDSERDVFSYILPSKSNSFVLLPSAPNYIWQQSERSKIAYTGSLSSFTLTDENGFRFDFQDQETTNSYISAWQLNTIQGTKPTEKAVFTYISNPQITFNTDIIDTEIYKTDIGGTNYEYGGTAGFQSETTTTQYATVNSKLLNEIFFPNGKIVFVSSPNRTDGLGRSLDRIEIYGFNVNNNSYSLIKQFVLNQSYKDGRLFLDSVDLKSNTGATIGSYSCTYNAQSLPDRDSRSKDFWGYYNGQNNATLLQAQTFEAYDTGVSGTPTTHNVGSHNSLGIGANRSPNETLMQARILTKLTYPTGGFTDFEYEAHRHDGGQIAGGLRIKSIVSNDGGSTGGVPQTITKTYKYGTNESGNGTYRDIWLNIPNKTYATVQTHIHKSQIPVLPESPDYNFKIWVFSSAFTQPMNPNEGSVVTYSTVTEYDDNGSGANGKTVYTYKDDVGDDLVSIPSAAKQMQKSRHWNRGQLLSKVVYGNDNRKKYEQINTYSTIISEESPILGYLIGKSIIPLAGFGVNANSTCQSFDGVTSINVNYTPLRQYKWATGLVKQIRSEEYTYDDTDDLKFVYKKAETDFDNTYFQAKEVRNFGSDGDIRIQKFRYVTDFSNLSNTLSGNALALYQMKQNNEINMPIEVLSFRKNTTDTEAKILGGKFTHFQTFNFNAYNYVLPDNIHLLEIPSSPSIFVSNFTFADVNSSGMPPSGNIVKDSHYAMRLNFGNYDTYAQLTDYQIVGNTPTAFTYSTTELDNIFHSFPTSETQNSGGTTSFTTNYSFDIPLLGIKEITSPNGLKSSFEYDNFGRFKRAKNHNGHITKEYDYNFGVGNNFVKELTPRIPLTSLSGSYSEGSVAINYFDGLGRPLQTVNYFAGFDALNDIVSSASVYDNLGRIEKSFVPFANVGSGAVAPLPTTVHGDTAPYSNVLEYDNSPLNRPKKAFGVGQAWRTADKFTENKYLIVPSGTIRKYTLTANGANVNDTWNTPLYKNVSISERGKEMIEYKDNDGKLIQKDIQDGEDSYASTHYIYDDFDRLKYIIQPESFKTAQSFAENDTYFQAGIFAYHYDKRGRTIESHMPSGGWTYAVFDILDRLVYSQSSLQQENDRWTFKKYDIFNRPILSGEITEVSSRAELQTEVDNLTSLTYEERNTSLPLYYSLNQGYPITTADDVYQAFYYDTYGFFDDNYLSPITNTDGLLTGTRTKNQSNNNWNANTIYYDELLNIVENRKAFSTKNTSTYTAIIAYNDYNFAQQLRFQRLAFQNDNINKATKKLYTFDHVGRKLTFDYAIGDNFVTPTFPLASYAYDEMGRFSQKKIRPDRTYQHIREYINRPQDGTPTPNTIDIAQKAIILSPNFSWNASTNGGNYTAQISDLSNGTGLQTIDYAYHIRGGLLGINLDASKNLKPSIAEADLFSYKLDYDGAGFYDGNIGKQSWVIERPLSATETRSYTFTYDDSNRLLSGTYTGIGSESYSLSNLTYDKNGNIKTLQRNGKIGTAYSPIDDLNYTYIGNRLNTVTDAIGGNHEVDFVPHGGNGYTYYTDGSTKSDANEQITNIVYDTYLKQPMEVELSDGRKINHYYDGSGTLLKTLYSTGETWEFYEEFILKNGAIHQVTNDEGRSIPNGANGWIQEFDYKDHLGNTRLTFRDSLANPIDGIYPPAVIVGQTSFDPFGVVLNGAGQVNNYQNRFEYQGKESEKTFGLNRINLGARTYNPTIGRMDGVDMMSQKFHSFSSYNANFNNPLSFIDPDGNEATGFMYSDGYSTLDSRNSTGGATQLLVVRI